jgi:hypothetical protein
MKYTGIHSVGPALNFELTDKLGTPWTVNGELQAGIQ